MKTIVLYYHSTMYIYVTSGNQKIALTNNPVAIFDSGIGSLSIIRELRHEVPYENLLYFADRAHFPYGTKSHLELPRDHC